MSYKYELLELKSVLEDIVVEYENKYDLLDIDGLKEYAVFKRLYELISNYLLLEGEIENEKCY